MAVPKNKISKSKTNSRYANWKLKATGLVECPQCHELIKSHTVNCHRSMLFIKDNAMFIIIYI